MDKINLNFTEQDLLKRFVKREQLESYAHYLRVNGEIRSLAETPAVQIVPKPNGLGLDVIVLPKRGRSVVYLPVIISRGGIDETVCYDYHIMAGAEVTINSGCALHNESDQSAIHNSIHRFRLDAGAKLLYVEDHYGESFSHAPCIINPNTKVKLGVNSQLEIITTQFAGLSRSKRKLRAELGKNSVLKISERLITEAEQSVATDYRITLRGANSRAELTSRSVASDTSRQSFRAVLRGNQACFAHSACDAIVRDSAKVESLPAVFANHAEAQLVHEAAIGRIAGDQILKLMTLGLSAEAAEQKIIAGFLR